MNDLLAKLLPTVATLVAGPLAGGLVSWLGGKLGVDPANTQAVTDAIQGMNPEDRMKLEIEAGQWAILEQDKMIQAYLADTQNARARDTEFLKAGTHNYRADFMFVLAVALVSGMIYIVWRDPQINEYAKGIFTLVLGRFLGYLDNIYSFEFGTTRASKTKDETISNLSNTK